MSDSRIKGLYRLGIAERISELQRLGWLSAADAELLRQGKQTLLSAAADKMVENAVGVFGLPFAIAPNFIVNGRDYVVPMVVEEPSVVAAVSRAAMTARATGGFTVSCSESLLIGQVHVCNVADSSAALERIQAASDELLAACNSVHPRLTERGGGVRQIESRRLEIQHGEEAIAVHLLVDTCDAMGANLVNTICEAIAPRLGELCGGDVALRILSNLSDRSLVTAQVRYALGDLVSGAFTAEVVRDRIVQASDIAHADVYRAATHNKGIMNGVDAVAIATGNDWRAIEAGAHAYAASDGQYRPLANWSVDDNGDLVGDIVIPLKVGIVGGSLDANAGAALGLRICGVATATELAELMAAVGLAQNFSALRALATSGIQEGHMKLHARSVASSANVPDELFDAVVDALVECDDIKVWKAVEIVAVMQQRDSEQAGPTVSAAGKVILLGEHAVVYGKHALALPIANAVTAEVTDGGADATVTVAEWGIQQQLIADDASGIGAVVSLVRKELGVADPGDSIRLHSSLPRAMGLGSSAAFAVAVARALSSKHGLDVDDARINSIAFECEKLAHGTPSGIDNTISTYGVPMLFRNAGTLESQRITMTEPPPIVVACSSQPGLTKQQVANVRERRERSRTHYDAIFSEMDALSQAGAAALASADYAELGRLMNICHGLLNAIEVSNPELENMVGLARAAGAAGAKVTGAGGGGSIVALCPGSVIAVRDALRSAGYRTLGLD